MPDSQVHTYHCICTELVIATFAPIQRLPKRKVDGAAICKVTNSNMPIPGAVVLSGSTFDDMEPMVINLEDGFEKRYGARCRRCDLPIGYWLDKSQFEEKENGMRTDVLYLLPGSLMSTEDMKAGKDMEKDIELVAGVAG
ncbi:hypothetical protein LTR37_015193 [Vermiconidia calcicola]|uniref:Uncharacterized protein n=1 Tax=Vermiconidia calcicola TaxID=1690605 RepID=A0ACC3MRN3_9PEZI|nr:hypothetical protein LTR37_015193 [Vermiconidia calcicola]